MYFPYLRGKQFELIALREFAIQYPNTEQIIPIIEPVKSTFNGLTTAARIMFEQNLRFALVLNPADGDFKRITKDILSEYLFFQKIWRNGFLHFYIKIMEKQYYRLYKIKN